MSKRVLEDSKSERPTKISRNELISVLRTKTDYVIECTDSKVHAQFSALALYSSIFAAADEKKDFKVPYEAKPVQMTVDYIYTAVFPDESIQNLWIMYKFCIVYEFKSISQDLTQRLKMLCKQPKALSYLLSRSDDIFGKDVYNHACEKMIMLGKAIATQVICIDNPLMEYKISDVVLPGKVCCEHTDEKKLVEKPEFCSYYTARYPTRFVGGIPDQCNKTYCCEHNPGITVTWRASVVAYYRSIFLDNLKVSLDAYKKIIEGIF